MIYIFGGKDYYIAIFPPICQGGKWLYSHFSGGKIYFIAIFRPIQVRGKNGYIAIFPGGWGEWLWGKNDSITPAGRLFILFFIFNYFCFFPISLVE